MNIIDKNHKEILSDNNLNLKFNSVSWKNSQDLSISSKILSSDFYLDSYNYYPITKELNTFKHLFSWGDKNKYLNFYSDLFLENFNQNKNSFKNISDTFVLGASASNNYYRNMLTFLPRIFFISEKKIKLAIHRKLSNKFRVFILDICKKLNKEVQFIFLDDDFYSFKNSQIPSFINKDNAIRLLSSLRLNSDFKNEKIYLSRQNSSYRNLINEGDVIDYLKPKGFRVMDLNNFSIGQQIEIFSNASVVISPTGSSLTNTIFCKPGTQIIEIAPEYQFDYENIFKFRYQHISAQLGLDYTCIKADSLNTDQKKNKNSYKDKEFISAKVLKESNYYKDLIIELKLLKKII